MNLDSKKEIVFYYESVRANPNGDPGFDNQPRMYHDDTVMVTDVRIKRTVRDYAKRADTKNVLFVDSLDTGEAEKADDRARRLLEEHKWTFKINKNNKSKGGKNNKLTDDKNLIKAGLLAHTFDVPLFGALVTIREGGEGSAQITGPCQFGMAKSVNKTEIITNQITSKFVGRTEKQGTFGSYSVVNYALIKCMAIIDPANLEYGQLKKAVEELKTDVNIEDVKTNFEASESKLCEYLWKGTNSLNSRSKIPQRSVLLVEVEYDGKSYTDLDTLVNAKVNEKVIPKNHAAQLEDIVFDLETDFEKRLTERKDSIIRIRIARDPRIAEQIDHVISRLEKVLPGRVERLKINE